MADEHFGCETKVGARAHEVGETFVVLGDEVLDAFDSLAISLRITLMRLLVNVSCIRRRNSHFRTYPFVP